METVTCDHWCRVLEVGSLLGLLTGYHRCMVWQRDTSECVDMRP